MAYAGKVRKGRKVLENAESKSQALQSFSENASCCIDQDVEHPKNQDATWGAAPPTPEFTRGASEGLFPVTFICIF